jgi:tRNA (guanine37-N1)-methyltransferase
MRIDVVSIFGEYMAPLHLSLVGRAIADGLIDLEIHDLRTHTHDRHRTVDDAPYGGGPGMVMKPEPWGEALRAVLAAGNPDDPVRIVVPTPSGRPFTQAIAQQWSADPRLVFGCGRYEGIDSRVVTWARTLTVGGRAVEVDEVSIGDYVLAGAEAAVLVMVEAVARLIPGVLGNEASHADDSFAPGAMERLLEGPVYTRPPGWEGMAVPEVLTSGDHAAVARWRHEQALARTRQMRPDLLLGPVVADADG